MNIQLPPPSGLSKALGQALKSAAFLAMMCAGNNLYAAGKPCFSKVENKNLICPADALRCPIKNTLSPPVVSYATPQTFTAGTAITPVSPTSSGVDAAGYSNSGVAIGSGFSHPQGVAMDAAGNIYIADTNNNRVVKMPAGGGAMTTIGSGFPAPTGIAVDPAGTYMYVAEYSNNLIKKVKISDGSIAGTYNLGVPPAGVAVSASGTLYIMVGGSDGTGIEVLPVGARQFTVIGINGLYNPTGLAADVAGNVFVTDSGNNTLTEVPFQGGKPVTLASGFNQPAGVAVDPSGNLFVADAGNNAIEEIPMGSNTPMTIGGGFSSPAALAVDPAGDVYIADAGNNAVEQLSPVGGYYLSAALPAGLSFNTGTGVISGTPLSGSPATNYTITAYNATGSSQAVINIKVKLPPFPTVSYSGPQAYTVGVAISPLLPSGSGTAAPGFSTAATSYVGESDVGIAFDAAGNFYEGHQGRVTEIPAGSSSSVQVGPPGTYITNGIVVDNKDNVFLTIHSNFDVVKEIPAGLPADERDTVTIAGGFKAPEGIAIDGAGNLYVADSGNGSIKKLAAGGWSVTTVVSGLTNPQGLAIDMQGNLYVTEYSPNNDVKEFPANGGAPVVLASGLNQPTGLAVDPGGNVYFSDFDNEVKRIPAGGGTAVMIGSSYSNPNGLVFDPFGKLFVSDVGHPDVNFIKPVGGYFISPNLPPGLSFNSATGAISGTPTAASASTVYSISGWNVSGKTTATVTISVKAPDATLSLLKVKGYALSPAFALAVTNYTVTVANTVGSVILTPTVNDPAATVKINGTTVASGAESSPITLAVGTNTINTVVTAFDGTTTKTYTVTVTRAAANANLAKLTVSGSTVLSPAFTPATTSYTSTVPNTVTGVTVTPSASAVTSTIKVNGTTVASGSASPTIPLSVGSNTITTIVTAGDGSTTKTYTVVITRQAPGANAALSGLTISAGVLTPVFSPTKTSYTAAESNGHSSITLTPTTSDPEATVKVNGTAVTSGTASGAIPLAVGPNTITVVVTGHDGTTTETYTLTVTRAPSTNDNLARLVISEGAVLSPAFSPATTSYTASVIEGVSSVTVTPTASDGTASITVNGGAVASGSPSGNIPLAIGPNTISTVVKAQDGTTTKTYTVTVTRESGGADGYVPVSVTKPAETPVLAEDGIMVHQGVSPNGDGVNDFLQIDNISQYPDNKLSIMNRNGQLVFETKGYDNSSKVFDGHSNKTGVMQVPGTYFYSLEYKVKGVSKRKTGYIVLKY